MQMTKERPKTIRTLRGWAIHVLQETGAIRECEEHGWAQDGGPGCPRFDRRHLSGVFILGKLNRFTS
jgi:hypothetical protein